MNKRGRFTGVLQIVRYNARFYLAAPIAIAVLFRIAKTRRLPRALKVLAVSAAALAAWWSLASLLVSHWVYDRSPLYRWRWIAGVLHEAPRCWLNLHCGLDETTSALHEIFPGAQGTTLDFFDGEVMREPSIRIARQQQKALAKQNSNPEELQRTNDLCQAADLRALPCADESFDVVFLIFSAHEIREANLRVQFFHEVARVLRPGGRVLLVEHPRDAANFLAFGPGFFHFWTRAHWRFLVKQSGLTISSESAITPFVRVWLLEK